MSVDVATATSSFSALQNEYLSCGNNPSINLYHTGRKLILQEVLVQLEYLLQILLHRNYRWMRNPTAQELVIQLEEQDEINEILAKIMAAGRSTVFNLQITRLENSLLEVKLYITFTDNRNIHDIVKLLRDIPQIKGISL